MAIKTGSYDSDLEEPHIVDQEVQEPYLVYEAHRYVEPVRMDRHAVNLLPKFLGKLHSERSGGIITFL